MPHSEQEQEQMKKFADWLNWRATNIFEELLKMEKDMTPPYAPAKFERARKVLMEANDILTDACDYYNRRADGLDY